MVECTRNEDFIVIFNRLRAVEFLWFLESAVQLCNLIVVLCVQNIAIRNPAIVPSKNDDFAIIYRKRAQSIRRTPRSIFVD